MKKPVEPKPSLKNKALNIFAYTEATEDTDASLSRLVRLSEGARELLSIVKKLTTK